MNETEKFEIWLKTTTSEKRKTDSTAYNYSRAIKRIEQHYKETTGENIYLFHTPIELAEKLLQKYSLNGEYSEFGKYGNGTIRNALSALIRYRKISPNIEIDTDFQSEVEEFPNFHYENDLQETILFQINELFPDYKIFGDNSEEGVKYRIEGKEIDILLESLDGESLLIIELKASKANEKVFGQIAMYYGLIKKKYPAKNIRGLIIAQEIADELLYAGGLSEKISFMTYSLQVKLLKIY